MVKLKRALSLHEAIFYGVGIILGAGIYALIGKAAGLAGNSLWLSFVIGAIVASFTGLSYAELSTMFPKASAEYVYVRKAFGSRFLAFLVGWLIAVTGIFAASTVALGFAGYFKELFGFSILPVALALIGILSFINFLGIKESSKFNIVFTGIEIFGLVFIIFLGLSLIGKVNYLEAPFGVKGILSASVLVFFAYIGFEDIAKIAEEVKNPRKNLARAFVLAILITTLLYVLTSISAVSLANWKDLAISDAPLAFAASQVLGGNAFLLISLIALFATANTVLIILIATSRMLYGMAREKSLPEELALVHEKTRTPWLAIVIVMIFSMLFLFFGDIAFVASLTSLSAFVTFLAVNLSLIWLRYAMPRMKRAFRVPGNIGNYPVIAFLGVFSCLLMIFQFDLSLILFGMLVTAVGTIAYLIFRKKFI